LRLVGCTLEIYITWRRNKHGRNRKWFGRRRPWSF